MFYVPKIGVIIVGVLFLGCMPFHIVANQSHERATHHASAETEDVTDLFGHFRDMSSAVFLSIELLATLLIFFVFFSSGYTEPHQSKGGIKSYHPLDHYRHRYLLWLRMHSASPPPYTAT